MYHAQSFMADLAGRVINRIQVSTGRVGRISRRGGAGFLKSKLITGKVVKPTLYVI